MLIQHSYSVLRCLGLAPRKRSSEEKARSGGLGGTRLVATMLPPFSGIFQAPIVAALFMRGFYLEGLILRTLAARGAFHMQMPGRDRVEAFRNVRSVRHEDRLAAILAGKNRFCHVPSVS